MSVIRQTLYAVLSTMKQWCLNRILRLRKRQISIVCIVLISILIPYYIMFFTRGCRHTKIVYNYDRPDTFRHGHPKRLPDHLYPEVTNISEDAEKQAYDILGSPVPPIVHFIWCSSGYFQFQNYMSVLAAVRFLKPASIFLHYDLEPELDKDGYYQFYMDLKQLLPHLYIKPLGVLSHGCSEDIRIKMAFVMDLLYPNGGIYIDLNTVISDSLRGLRKENLKYVSHLGNLALVLMSSRLSDKEQTKPQVDAVLSDPQHYKATMACSDHVHYTKGSDLHCAYISKEIFPVDIFELSGDFGSLARWVAYGRTELMKPSPANTTVIPNIVHYVWLGDRPFKYFSYISLLSSLYILNVDMVYIHGDIEPKGSYWEKMKTHKRVKFIVRDFPGAVFSEPIVKFASHASDYLRGDVLIRYGGIYADWDVLWVRPIPDDLRRYETVICPDFPATGAFPDVFNMGVLLAAQGSHYLRFFLESYHHYLDGHWSYNAIHMPYKVYEKHADLVHIDRHLQVICAQGLCHPVWVPNFKDANVHHLSSAEFDWRTDTYAMHWTHPDPEEFESEQSLADSISLFGSIGKHILRKAEQQMKKELR